MSKAEIISASLIASVAIALLDFSFFFQNPRAAFAVHNALSILTGILLVVFGYRLVKTSNPKMIHGIAFIVGVFMVAVHITKLIIGKVF